ncbi:MAG: hypothetical protein WEE64_02430 [Dehalococcoidia bacterium]
MAIVMVGALPAQQLANAQTESPPTVRIVPATASVPVNGGALTFEVQISGLDQVAEIPYDDNDPTPGPSEISEGLGAFELTFTFNPEVLRLGGGMPGAFLGSTGREAQCASRGGPEEYVLGCFTTGAGAGPQGSGVLATVDVYPVNPGTSAVELDAGLAGPLADEIGVVTEGAVVEVLPIPTSTGAVATASPTSTSLSEVSADIALPSAGSRSVEGGWRLASLALGAFVTGGTALAAAAGWLALRSRRE